jgi:hypothetical protein
MIDPLNPLGLTDEQKTERAVIGAAMDAAHARVRDSSGMQPLQAAEEMVQSFFAARAEYRRLSAADASLDLFSRIESAVKQATRTTLSRLAAVRRFSQSQLLWLMANEEASLDDVPSADTLPAVGWFDLNISPRDAAAMLEKARFAAQQSSAAPAPPRSAETPPGTSCCGRSET